LFHFQILILHYSLSQYVVQSLDFLTQKRYSVLILLIFQLSSLQRLNCSSLIIILINSCSQHVFILF
jgi:hypothetical protein